MSLYDWNTHESANSFMGISHSESWFNSQGFNKNLCQTKLTELKSYHDLKKIIDNWYSRLDNRYLCVFAFTDEQLDRYVDICKERGYIIQKPQGKSLKEIIKEIQENYNGDNYYQQSIQARILTTGPESPDPYITYILDDDLNVMKEEIKQYFNDERERKEAEENSVREQQEFVKKEQDKRTKERDQLVLNVEKLFDTIDSTLRMICGNPFKNIFKKLCYILPSKNNLKNLHSKKFNYRFRQGYDLKAIENSLIMLRSYYNAYIINTFHEVNNERDIVRYSTIDELRKVKKQLENIKNALDDYHNKSFGGTRKQKTKLKKSS